MMAKDKMNKKNKTGATFTDDGFAMSKQLEPVVVEPLYQGRTPITSQDLT